MRPEIKIEMVRAGNSGDVAREVIRIAAIFGCSYDRAHVCRQRFSRPLAYVRLRTPYRRNSGKGGPLNLSLV